MKIRISGGMISLVLLCALHLSGPGGCGSSATTTTGTDTGALSVQATVTSPTSASLSLPALKIGQSGMVVYTHKRIEEAVATGVAVHAEDDSGEEIGTGCTTGADGACEITDLTSAQLTAGYVIVADDGDVPLHAFEKPTEAEVTAAEAAGEPLEATVDTESDLTFAVLQSSCDDDIANCAATFDSKCIRDAIPSLVGDDDASADNLGGYMEALFQAHANAIAGAATSGINPADLMKDALGGNPTAFAAAAGATVSDVPVTDAVTNAATMITSLTTAYCAPVDGIPPWNTASAAADFDPKAMVGVFKEFTGAEIGDFSAVDFRGFAQALPNLTGGFQMFGDHPEARRALGEQFRLGSFATAANAGPALGFMAATFPPCTSAATCRALTFDRAFDPSVSARAANNGFLEYVGNTTTFVNPNAIYQAYNVSFSDVSNRQAFATGGSSAFGTLISGFAADPNFRPADHLDQIKAPPGGACTTNADCLPCDACSGSVCTSLSTKMGASCQTNSDCGGDILACVGGFSATAGGHCMCQAGVPTGAFVHATQGQGPQAFGETGGFIPPTQGSVGALCTRTSDCVPPLSCSGGSAGGVCLNSSTFKKGPFSPCSASAECESASCTGGLCAAFTATQIQTINTTGGGGSDGPTIGSRTAGQPCATPSECASFFCSAGTCSTPPVAFNSATAAAGLKADGLSCTLPSECLHSFCQFTGGPTGVCATPTQGGGGNFGPPTNQPAGAPCFTNTECASTSCNFSTHVCNGS